MTWFRVGGAGVPVSLKNGMNAVLNKKFGTSGQNYPPNQWPDDVNLLGPLPEGTASGSIANFSDGADRVPIKNWLVNLPASLSGYSEVNGYKQGANVIDYASNLTTGTSGGLTFSVTTDGGISYSGTATSTFAYMTAKFDFNIKSGQTFTFSRNTAFNYIHRITLTFSDNTTENVSISANNTSVTYTPAKDVSSVRLLVAGLTANTSYNDTVYLQTEYGNAVTTFELYTAPEVSVVDLDRTIYGGTADIVTGEGSDNCIRIQIKNRTWEIVTVGSFQVFSCNKISNKAANFNFQVEGYENAKTYRNYLQDKQCGTYNTTNAMDRIVIRDDSYTTVEDFITAKGDNYIVYENTSPTDFTFDGQEINSLYGVNNFWNDAEGDTTVVYRRDIDLALQAVSSSRGLMMASRPVTQLVGEESDPDQVNELVEDDETEQEGENDAR